MGVVTVTDHTHSLIHLQGPVWSMCTIGDLLFSASSDSTIKVAMKIVPPSSSCHYHLICPSGVEPQCYLRWSTHSNWARWDSPGSLLTRVGNYFINPAIPKYIIFAMPIVSCCIVDRQTRPSKSGTAIRYSYKEAGWLTMIQCAH